MMGNEEGVIKYRSMHEPGCIEARIRTLPHDVRNRALESLRRLPELDAARTKLHDAGLIGISAAGIGFGNISLRLSNLLFLISGSATGGKRVLGADGYSLVEQFDAESNTVISYGPVQASSESMTHGAIYAASDSVQCVIHVHSAVLFRRLLDRGYPRTPESAAYGTPELSRSVTSLMGQLPASEGIFVTAGHTDGLFAYGKDIETALAVIFSLTPAGAA